MTIIPKIYTEKPKACTIPRLINFPKYLMRKRLNNTIYPTELDSITIARYERMYDAIMKNGNTILTDVRNGTNHLMIGYIALYFLDRYTNTEHAAIISDFYAKHNNIEFLVPETSLYARAREVIEALNYCIIKKDWDFIPNDFNSDVKKTTPVTITKPIEKAVTIKVDAPTQPVLAPKPAATPVSMDLVKEVQDLKAIIAAKEERITELKELLEHYKALASMAKK